MLPGSPRRSPASPGGGGGNRQQPFNIVHMCNNNNQIRESFRSLNILAVAQVKYRQCITALEIVNGSITVINLTQEKTHTITFLYEKPQIVTF